jgi:uncharacterized protein (TIGR02231 family)
LFAILFAGPAAGAEPINVESKVMAVTVYRGQALVTRRVALPQAAGELELLVSDLPARVVGASLHASEGAGVKIRSVRYRTRAVADEPKKEVAELDEAIKALGRKLQVNAEMMRLVEANARFVDKLEGFTAAAARAETEKAMLNPKTVAEMTSQIFDQRADLARQRIRLREEAEDIKEQINLLQRKRNELTRGRTRTIREAVIFVSKAARAERTIRLSYLVNSASWTPAYNIRMGEQNNSISVEYLAQVQQMSGEDWSGVKLTLSTATTAMNAQSPVLLPLWIGLEGITVDKDGELKPEDYLQAYGATKARQTGALTEWQKALTRRGREQNVWALNRLAAEAQGWELDVAGEIARAEVAKRPAAEGLAVSYELEGAMSLASRSDSQLVRIDRIELAAESYHAAIPVLSSYVYRIAKANNTSGLPLLAGEYSAYVGGEFVGRGDLPVVARGQKFTIGFGVDTQLRCGRELMDKSDRVSWGSRVQKFVYRLRVENYKDRPVEIRLLDRMPTTMSDEIRITLGKVSEELSTDSVYVRDFKGRGILRWDLSVAAQAAGARARDIAYEYEMKYAKDVHIGKRAAPEMLKQEGRAGEYSEFLRAL